MWWLKEDALPIDADAERQLTTQLGSGEAASPKELAISLRDVMIENPTALFQSPHGRLDVLVLHGNAGDDDDSFYEHMAVPLRRTDGGNWQLEDSELEVFAGQVKYFVDISILVSRSVEEESADDHSRVITDRLSAQDLREAVAALRALKHDPKQAAVVLAAVRAASTLSNACGDALLEATKSTTGLYRASYLHRDRFGAGSHPASGVFKVKRFAFAYEVMSAEVAPATVADAAKGVDRTKDADDSSGTGGESAEDADPVVATLPAPARSSKKRK